MIKRPLYILTYSFKSSLSCWGWQYMNFVHFCLYPLLGKNISANNNFHLTTFIGIVTLEHNAHLYNVVWSTDGKNKNYLLHIIYSTTGKEGQNFFNKWSHVRISSTDWKIRTTVCSVINYSSGEWCLVAFIWMVTCQSHICLKFRFWKWMCTQVCIF